MSFEWNCSHSIHLPIKTSQKGVRKGFIRPMACIYISLPPCLMWYYRYIKVTWQARCLKERWQFLFDTKNLCPPLPCGFGRSDRKSTGSTPTFNILNMSRYILLYPVTHFPKWITSWNVWRSDRNMSLLHTVPRHSLSEVNNKLKCLTVWTQAYIKLPKPCLRMRTHNVHRG
jgi:hypothetical protein